MVCIFMFLVSRKEIVFSRSALEIFCLKILVRAIKSSLFGSFLSEPIMKYFLDQIKFSYSVYVIITMYLTDI